MVHDSLHCVVLGRIATVSSDLRTIDQNFHAILVVKADEPFHSSALVCGVRVIPN